MEAPQRNELNHIGSLITYRANPGDDKETCLGSLMHFAGKGVYDPNCGRVDVTPEEADAHNKALDTAMLGGMDEHCEIGQGSFAYRGTNGIVSTFIGTVIARDAKTNGASITFTRAGKTYRGRLSKQHDSFNFKRTA